MLFVSKGRDQNQHEVKNNDKKTKENVLIHRIY